VYSNIRYQNFTGTIKVCNGSSLSSWAYQFYPGNPKLDWGIVGQTSESCLLSLSALAVQGRLNPSNEVTKRSLTSTGLSAIDLDALKQACVATGLETNINCWLRVLDFCRLRGFGSLCDSAYNVSFSDTKYEDLHKYCDQERVTYPGNKDNCKAARDGLCADPKSGQCIFANVMYYYIYPNKDGMQYSRGSLNAQALY